MHVLRYFPRTGRDKIHDDPKADAYWQTVFEALDVPPLKERLLLSNQGNWVEESPTKMQPLAKFLSDLSFTSICQFYTSSPETFDTAKGQKIRSTSLFAVAEDMSHLTKDELMYKELQVVMALLQAVAPFSKFFRNRIVLVVSHSAFYSVVSQALNLFTTNDYFEIVNILGMAKSKRAGWSSSIVNMVKNCSHSLNLLGAMSDLERYELTDFKRRMETALNTYKRNVEVKGEKNRQADNATGLMQSIFKELDDFDKMLRRLESILPDLQVFYSISPKIPPQSGRSRLWQFHSGMAFSLFAGREKHESRKINQSSSEVCIAYGGRFDNLIESYRASKKHHTLACGFVLRTSCIVDCISQTVEETDRDLKEDASSSKGTAVVVCSYATSHHKEKFDFATLLWKAGVKTDIITPPINPSKEKEVFAEMKKRGILFAAVVYLKSPGHPMIKLRNFKSHKDPEYNFEAAVEYLAGNQEHGPPERNTAPVLDKLKSKLS